IPPVKADATMWVSRVKPVGLAGICMRRTLRSGIRLHGFLSSIIDDFPVLLVIHCREIAVSVYCTEV
ncbi:MAG: hypothetical protein QNL87_06005, partial [Gammaproteobacteria bacterium]|nr:hypothetical protein [Gammaproteobacteria bacterium]